GPDLPARCGAARPNAPARLTPAPTSNGGGPVAREPVPSPVPARWPGVTSAQLPRSGPSRSRSVPAPSALSAAHCSDSRPPLLQQACVDRLLRQDVLEGVLLLRQHPLLIDQLPIL